MTPSQAHNAARAAPLVTARGRTMVSVELMVGYLTLAMIAVTVVVLCCLVCSCHVPLRKCARCLCDETRRCCPKQPEKLAASETAAQRVKREKGAPALAGRRRAPGADDAPPCAGCLRGIPWVLTCGYCCGAFRDAVATNRQLAESPVQRKREGKAPAAVMGQPVFEDDASETGHAVTVAMPLLAVG